MGALFVPPYMRYADSNGRPLSGALANFYLTGTTTRATIYADAACSVPSTNPVVADSSGNFPAIFFDGLQLLKCVLTAADGSTIRTVDPCNANADAGGVLYVQAGAGGQVQSIGTVLASQPQSVMQFIPATLHAGVRNGTNTTDLAPYLALAAAFSKTLHFPAGRYRINSTFDASMSAMIGDGSSNTIIEINSTSSSAVRFKTSPNTTSTFKSLVFQGFTITRVGTPVSSAYGLDMTPFQGRPYVNDIICEGHWDGFVLGPTGEGLISNCDAQFNYNHGFRYINTSEDYRLQWTSMLLRSINNDGRGFVVSSASGQANQPCPVGTFSQCYSHANTGGGIGFLAASDDRPITNIRLVSCFFGEDGGDEIYLDDRARSDLTHLILNCYTELAGLAATGRSFQTAASLTGAGLRVQKSSASIQVIGGKYNGNSENGITVIAAGRVELDAVESTDNSQRTANSYSGLYLGALTYGATVRGGWLGQVAANATQKWGANITDGTNVIFLGVNLIGNNSSPVTISSNASLIRFRDCIGYVTDTQGVATATTNGSGQITVNHGLSAQPTHVRCVARGTTFNLAVPSSYTATSFTVTCLNNSGTAIANTSVTIEWVASTQ